MISRYGQPTRARDVLRHIALIDLSGDPASEFVETVRQILNSPDGMGRYPRTYEQVAKRVGWYRGGPGDLLAKAIALIED